ncbi:peptidoglycan-binding protein [Roseibium aggregatum]|uniref:DUF11 domain-containing protein n=1 Tax=Roseibium aggregatum TaxID=187304 RepID=A0A939EAD4_9HYPH|nr:peptidoglycan-binding protein [Roseibium aggregatum]MBN9669766.1 DUF11 domain-containing protein [Roseibium aggregatum]
MSFRALFPAVKIHHFRRTFLIAAVLVSGVGVLAGWPARAQEALQPGEAVVTGFSGTVERDGGTVIDPDGAVARTLDLRQPGGQPQGEHWFNEIQRTLATARQTGQVFGVALDDATPPNIYLTASSAFGLHRNADNSGWMDGMWGESGGPGTVWKLNGANGYQPEIFATVTLDGRQNSGAALGNIAFDRWNRQLYVSDLETGMIHGFAVEDGAERGVFDHGVDGRTSFLETSDGQFHSLPAVPFDPARTAQVDDCGSGDFARTPSCWNFADFRRRVWGLGVRRDAATQEVRLYYAVWSSQGFGNPDFGGAPVEARKNALWSVGLDGEGAFDPMTVRREFILPDFFRSPEAIARSGFSHPVSDIAFPAASVQDVMLLAERGGVRNLGLAAADAFASPYESRVLRYELSPDDFWRPAGRYDVGYYDRAEAGPPYLRAGSAGGVSFGPGYQVNGEVDLRQPDGFVWMTGDGLCSERGRCFDSSSGEHNDGSQVHGLQGRGGLPYEAFEPVTAFQTYPSPGPASPTSGPDRSFMVDVDQNTDPSGNYIEEDRFRNDASRVGDVVAFQEFPADGALPNTGAADFAGGGGLAPGAGGSGVPWPQGLPPQGWYPAPPPPPGGPGGGWFPPPPLPLDTDLAIRKEGPANCQEGVNCTYVITIRNVGLAPYTGPLAISDAMPAGATLASTSPGWNCAPAGAEFRCVTNAPALLAPGATAAIEVVLLLPPDIPGPSVQNCAEIDWFEMGTDDGPDSNDDDCVSTPIVDGFNLELEKTGPAVCAENALCSYSIGITNHGPGEFSGIVAFRDRMPAGASLIGGTIGWSCLQIGSDVECRTTDAITLPPLGAYGTALALQLPDGIAPGIVDNCAEINWGAMGADDGTPDPHADMDCHTVNVANGAGFHDLLVRKAGPAHCDSGGTCDYTITVTNFGPGDYTGTIVIQDTPPAGYTYVSGSAGWTCVPGPLIGCTLDGGIHTLHPGDSHSLTLTLSLPAPAAADLNCVNIAWGWGGMPPDDSPAPGGTDLSDNACFLANVDDGFDLALDKTGPAECYEGAVCEYTVSLTNTGPSAFSGFVAFNDVLPAGATLESVDGAWACQEDIPGTVACNLAAFWFPAGFTQDIVLRVRLPDPVIGTTVENCAVMNWGAVPAPMFPPTFTGDDDPTTDGPVCVTTPVLAADLAPWGATTCQLGSDCPIEVRIENRGGRLFKGAAGLVGTLDPAVTIASIDSRTKGLTCSVTGTGTYACQSDDLTLKPDAVAEIAMVLEIPKDFPHKRIVHRKEMSWPDLAVKDEKPENDRHTSTIMILQPEEPQQQGEPEPPVQEPADELPQAVVPVVPAPSTVQAADLSIAKSAGQNLCRAGETCRFQVNVTNTGPVAYTGRLRVSDQTAPPSRLGSSGPGPWRCGAGGGGTVCTHPVTTLAPGETRILTLNMRPGRSGAGSLRNCAGLDWSEADRVRAVQGALNDLGFPAGPADGAAGPNTRRAVRAYQESLGLPATGRIDGALLDRLFVSWGNGDANAANDNACVTVALDQPVEIPPAIVPPPVVVPPIVPPPAVQPLTCPPGYIAYWNRNRIPKNSEVIRRVRGNQVLFCARPQAQATRCPNGWRQVSRSRAQTLRNQGWEIRRVGNLTCARQLQQPPQAEQCPRGWQQVSRSRAQTLRNQGWQIRRVGNLTCARKPQQQPPQAEQCPRGWEQVNRNRAESLRNQGWQIRRVGNLTCARKPQQQPPQAEQCPRGWEQVSRNRAQSLRNQGWQIRQVGKLTCGRRPQQQQKPKQQTQQCPRGWQQVDRSRVQALRLQGWEIRRTGNLNCARRPRGEQKLQ